PYYGIDDDFTEQYVREANNLAAALGGNANTYRTTEATIENIADAIESGAVVIFDSHGDTDYAKGDDYTSQANTSYICLQTNNGLTSQDYEVATGQFGQYYHAYYAGFYGAMRYYCVDGTAIANHMEEDAENSMLWMAICLGMATEGLHVPLRNKGVEIVYGYSQSVTFDYDYLWEESFWKQMILGNTVKDSIAVMKSEIGLWDLCHDESCDTVEEARVMYRAFPIVVSSEDVYPGHGKVDALQEVHSTWKLVMDCDHFNLTFVPEVSATCTQDGNISYYLCETCNAVFTDETLTERILLSATVLNATGHSYDEGVITLPLTCTTNGVMTYTCQGCGDFYTEDLIAQGHQYVDGYCSVCGYKIPAFTEFTKGTSGTFVLAANANGTYFALPNTFGTPSGKMKGKEINASQGFVEEDFATDLSLEFTYYPETGTYTIKNKDYYLRYPTGTNLGGSTTPYYWTITEGVNGSWRIASSVTNKRGIIYRAAGYAVFGGYFLDNVYHGSREYFDMEILPIGKAVPEEEPTVTVDETIIIQHSLNLASDISINYAVKTALVESYDSFYLSCEIPIYENGELTDVKTVKIEPVLKGNYYYFTLTGITAVQMGDEVRSVLYLSKGGQEYCSTEDLYSVATYAYNLLGNSSNSDSLKKLCAELLRYGSYAQIYKGYRLDTPVDSLLSETDRAYFTDLESLVFHNNNTVYEDVEAPTVTWAGKTLNLESKVVIRFIANLSHYEGSLDEIELRLTYTDYKGEVVNLTLTDPKVYSESSQYYAFDLDCLTAAELRTIISAAVYQGSIQVSPTLVYSADAYGIGKSGTLLNLCQALISYSDAALAYFM
ncbi:MAG: hypothetical protein IKM59_02875, partial [Oscillospiraceae bacterium]|nr:hypothetical protein [Oscillospiraceae bacterium]